MRVSPSHYGFCSFCVAVLLLTSGCVVLPLAETGPLAEAEAEVEVGTEAEKTAGKASDRAGKNEVEESDLVGLSREEVRTRLGEPDFTLELQDSVQLLYSAPGGKGHLLLAHPIMLAFLIPPVWAGTADVLHCLLVEIRDGKAVGAELKSKAPENSTAYAGCPVQFWTEDEFVAVLSALAEQGDRDAAYELAREFFEPKFLRAIAEKGDKDAAFELARDFDEPKFIRAIAKQGDRKAAFMLARKFEEPEFIRAIAEQGDKEATFLLAREFDEPKFIRAIAEQGDRQAAFMLARKFEEPTFIRALAEQGDRNAAIELAEIFGDLGPLKRLAEQGDDQAAFEIYEQLTAKEELNSDSLKWLCKAANAGHAKAQKTLGHLHHSIGEKDGQDTDANSRIAYMWYSLAAANGARTSGSRNILAKDMTDEDEARSEEMARDWKPGQCPAP